MNLRFKGKRLLYIPTLCVLFIMCTGKSFAQFGIQVSEIIPKGDIGQYYNKGKSIDIYFALQTDDGKWKYRFGFFYTNLTPRIDTAPICGVQYDGNNITVFPGFLVNHDVNMKCLSADIDRRLIFIHGFSLYIGLGLIMGISHTNYVKTIETISTETGDIDTKIAGLKANSMLEYRINDHFDAFIDGSKNFITSVNWATSYTNYQVGFGLHYFINARE